MKNNQPIPPEHQHIARGSGAAAILMFLQIAIIGYLGFLVWHFFTHWTTSGQVLLRPPAAILYYLPAYFLVATVLPTDNLTRTVARIGRQVGFAAAAVFLAAAIGAARHSTGGFSNNIGIIALTVFAGAALGALASLPFRHFTAPERRNFKKNTFPNEVSE